MLRYLRIKRALLLAGLLPCFAWLWVLFLFPEVLEDEHGYVGLMWAMAISLAHIPVGAFMMVLAKTSWFPLRIGTSILAAPGFHLLGSRMEGVSAVCMFTIPCLLSIGFVIVEIISDRQQSP